MLTVYDKVTVTAFSYSSTSTNVGQVTAAPTKTITGTAKSGPTYSSSNTSVATVDSSGKVTGVANGTATITISYTNYDGTTSTKTCSISVYNKVTITTFTYSSTNINVGATSSSPTKSITGTAKSGPTYSSSNTSVATVNSSTGIVTGKAAGSATITIKYTNYDGTTVSKTCSVTIKFIEPNIVINSNNTAITCKSSYVTDIALPASTNSGTYLGLTLSGATEGTFVFVKFSENIQKLDFASSNTSMPTTTTNTETTQSSSSLNLGFYEKTDCSVTDKKYLLSKYTLESGIVVTVKQTKESNSRTAKVVSIIIE